MRRGERGRGWELESKGTEKKRVKFRGWGWTEWEKGI